METKLSARDRMAIFKLMDLPVRQWQNYKHLMQANKNNVDKVHRILKAFNKRRKANQ